MQITKFVHSCLLVEEEEKIFLIDPGQYTYEANVLNIAKLSHLTAIIITHDHFDHFSLPLVAAILKAFPDTPVVSTPQVYKQLADAGIAVSPTIDPSLITKQVPHEEILFAPVPENVLVTVANTLTHPGDSYHFTLTTPVLAMPMTPPWGGPIEAMRRLIELKPKIVIPIHDWHWKDEAKVGLYPRVAAVFKTHNIQFLQVEDQIPFEV